MDNTTPDTPEQPDATAGPISPSAPGSDEAWLPSLIGDRMPDPPRPEGASFGGDLPDPPPAEESGAAGDVADTAPMNPEPAHPQMLDPEAEDPEPWQRQPAAEDQDRSADPAPGHDAWGAAAPPPPWSPPLVPTPDPPPATPPVTPNPDQWPGSGQPSPTQPLPAVGAHYPDPVRTHRPLYEYPIYDEPAPAVPEEPTKRRRWPVAALALISGLLGAGLMVAALWAGGVLDNEPAASSATVPGSTVVQRITEIVNAEGGGDAVAIAVGRKVVPSIVTVEVGFNGGTDFQAFASGSGVVLSSDGRIITNDHVIEEAEEIRVIFQDGRIYGAQLVGTDAVTDLAVLQIDATNLTAIEIGSTESLQIGETTIAVGNPLGLEGGASLTVGVLSAFNRRVDLSLDQALFGMLQTDAPITQGSSGGALVDKQGRLIGITTAIGVSSAGAEGIGFATPVELVTRITDEIIEIGSVRHAFLGVTGESYIEEGPDGVMRPGGALLAAFVGEISAAEDAGLEVGDRIVAVDGEEIRTMQDLINLLRLYRVGEAIEFDIIRDGEQLTAAVTLGERPADL
jgi:S1-C subfamily serine protease